MIDIREKKYTVYNLYEMFVNGRLVFPFKPIALRSLQIKAQEAMDILLLSIPFPTIYVSERQDGSFAVLDSSSRLLGLLQLLNQKFVYKSAGANHMLDGRKFSEIDRYAPSVTAVILDAKIRVEIIEYYTPLFLHMRTGLAVESWTIQQEQAVRNLLYEGEGIERLRWLASNMNMPGESGRSKEFCVLNILLVEFVCHAKWQEVASSEIYDEQYLFEETITFLEKLSIKKLDGLNNRLEWFGSFLKECPRSITAGVSYGKKDSAQYRTIAYLFQLWFKYQKHDISFACMEQMVRNTKLWRAIGKAAHSIEGIHRNMENLRRLMEC